MRARLIWWLSLLAGLVLLHAAGRGHLAMPEPWHGQAFTRRVRFDGAAMAGVAVLRQAMMAAGCYLMAVGVIIEAARLPAIGPAARALLRLPLPGVRLGTWRLLGVPVAVVGVTIASASVASAEPSWPSSAPTGAPEMVWLAPPTSSPLDPAGVPLQVGDAPVLHLLPPLPSVAPAAAGGQRASAPSQRAVPPPVGDGSPATPPSTAAPVPTGVTPATVPLPSAGDPADQAAPGQPSDGGPGTDGGAAAATATAAPDAPDAPSSQDPAGPSAPAAPAVPGAGGEAIDGTSAPVGLPSSYVLVPGDHLWAVADRTLTAELGRRPSAEALGRYWWRLVEANRSRLPDPGNADFVLPGMVVALPALDG